MSKENQIQNNKQQRNDEIVQKFKTNISNYISNKKSQSTNYNKVKLF
jgi:hypothetical protein